MVESWSLLKWRLRWSGRDLLNITLKRKNTHYSCVTAYFERSTLIRGKSKWSHIHFVTPLCQPRGRNEWQLMIHTCCTTLRDNFTFICQLLHDFRFSSAGQGHIGCQVLVSILTSLIFSNATNENLPHCGVALRWRSCQAQLNFCLKYHWSATTTSAISASFEIRQPSVGKAK